MMMRLAMAASNHSCHGLPWLLTGPSFWPDWLDRAERTD